MIDVFWGKNAETCIGVRVGFAMLLRVAREGLSVKRHKQKSGEGAERALQLSGVRSILYKE